MIQKYFLAWFPMVLLAVANGAVRELGYKPFVGDLVAHWLSTITFLCMLALYVWALGRAWQIDSSRQAWIIGGMWLCMTVAFEFGFGHYIMGHPWERLLHDYNIVEGRVWTVVLAATFLSPRIFYRTTETKSSLNG